MRVRPISVVVLSLLIPLLIGFLGCGTEGASPGGSGGTGKSGGSSGTAGAMTSGGVSGSGGAPSTGGTQGSGGTAGSTRTTGTGGVSGSGGTVGTGGASGGASGSGGTLTTGGTVDAGGATGTGGAGQGGSNPPDAAIGGRPGSGGTSSLGGATGTGGINGSGGATGSGGSTVSVTLPCDIYVAGGTPCVAAHSTVRALYGAYSGSLYQVQRASDKETKDIVVLTAGGFADSAAQDAFCTDTTCTISIIYDQSPKANHLTPAPGGGANKKPVNANKLKLTVGGHAVYGAYFEGGMGYRNNKTTGIATGESPESMYMVASGKHYNNQCCFDYGNAETSNNDDGEGTMETIYFGNCTGWGKGAGNGPWLMADIENGLWAGDVSPNNNAPSITSEYVTGMVKGKPGTFAIKSGDAQTGTLKTFHEGARPPKGAWGLPYEPMKKQGAIILGIGGDNSNWAVGTFFEGCMTTGYATNAVDEAVQANIVAVGYGK
jgi:hypothetical protein